MRSDSMRILGVGAILAVAGGTTLGVFYAQAGKSSDSDSEATGTVSGTLSAFPAGRDPLVVFLASAKGSTRTQDKGSTRTQTMSQKGSAFRPGYLLVGAGERVTFPNDDRITHSVFSLSKTKKFDLGLYKPGSNQTLTFEKPGVVDVFCSIHENMHAVIQVVPSGVYATVDAEGKFRLDGAAKGTYPLVVWRKGKELARQEVVVEEGKEATVAVTYSSPSSR